MKMIDFPDEFFAPPEQRDESTPDNPDVRRAVDWFKSFMSADEWRQRRNAAANRLYAAALQDLTPNDKGKFFDDGDTFGWYLFLAEAFVDHLQNYEPVFGSRVIPVFVTIGRSLDLLKGVDGVDDRVRRIVGPERRQPNGGLFELLVAAAYRRRGGEVAFVPEVKGGTKTHDMDVTLDGRMLAVECKRMEVCEYSERERMRMRELWRDSAGMMSKAERSTFGDVHFTVPIADVPDDYLTAKTKAWQNSGQASLLWKDDVGYGAIGELDLGPLKAELKDNFVLAAGTRIQQLLTGAYVRHANHIQVLRMKMSENPRYIQDCDLAIVLRWESRSPAAIDGKARDVLKKVAEATDQLPKDRPGIVHIGLEAVEGDAVEAARYEKVLATAKKFDPGEKPLEYVYVHYFCPESPPQESWAFDETTQWCSVRPNGQPHPFGDAFLVVPDENFRKGVHWKAAGESTSQA